MEQRRFENRSDDEDVHRAMGRQSGGTDAVCEPHAAEDFHGAGIAALHLGKELRRFLLLDERPAHARKPQIARKDQPDRARADDENLGVDLGDPPVTKEAGADTSDDEASPSRRPELRAMSMAAHASSKQHLRPSRIGLFATPARERPVGNQPSAAKHRDGLKDPLPTLPRIWGRWLDQMHIRHYRRERLLAPAERQ